jgi:hypothetical protein
MAQQLRARAYFRKPKADDNDDNGADNGRRELHFMKKQYGPLADVVSLQWRDGLWLPLAADVAAQYDAEALFLQLLGRFADQGRKVSANRGPTYAPTQLAEQPEAKEARASSRALAEAMERLLPTKQIVMRTEGPPSHRRSYLALSERLL